MIIKFQKCRTEKEEGKELEKKLEENKALQSFSKTYDVFSYADDEAERVERNSKIDDEPNSKTNDEPNSKIDNHCDCNMDIFFTFSSSPSRDNAKSTVICHRRPTSFWSVLFRQKVDFAIPFRVIWAGESSSDDGGPYREFLLYRMELIGSLTSHFFGSSNELMFTSFTDAVIQKQYYILGQLAALAILNIGRGPQCFHSVVTEVMFSLPRKTSIKKH